MEAHNDIDFFHLVKNTQYIFRNTLWIYLTTWSLTLVCLSGYVYKYINVLFLSLFVFIGGSGIFYLNPGFAKIHIAPERSVYLDGFSKMLFHIFAHVLPLVYVLKRYFKYYSSRKYDGSTMISLLIITIYLITMNVEKIYGASAPWIVTYFVISVVIYAII